MAKIVIDNLSGKEVIIKPQSRSILAALQDERVDWMHACGGKGRCTTCKLIVIKGLEQMSEKTPAETRYYQEGKLLDNERLACQARAWGDLVVRVPEEGKLPHLKYND